MARQDYTDAHFEIDIAKAFNADEENSGQYQQSDDLTHVQGLHKGLQQSVHTLRVLNLKED